MGKRDVTNKVLGSKIVIDNRDWESVFEEYTSKLEQKVAEQTQQLKQELVASEAERARITAILRSIGDGIVAMDRQGKIMDVNHAFEVLTGWSAAEVMGKDITKVLPMQSEDGRPLPFAERPYRQVLNAKRPGTFTTTSYYQRKDGSHFPVAITASPIRSGHESTGVVLDFEDITENKRAEKEKILLLKRESQARAEVEVERRRLQSMFNQAPAFIAVLRGPEHIYEYLNPEYHKLVGYREMVGKPVRQALPELAGQGFYELMDQVYRTGEPVVITEMMARLDRRGKGRLEEAYFNFAYQPSRGVDGEVEGILIHAVEVTEQVRVRQELQQNKERLELAQKAGNIGTFEWNINSGGMIWSAELEALYGLKPGAFEGKYSKWIQAVHKDDRKRVQAAMQSAAKEGAEFNTEFKVIHPDGSVRWIAGRGQVYYDAKNKPLRMIGINRDVTKRWHAEEALKASEQHFRSAFEQAAVGMAYTALDGAWLQVNQKLCDLLGYTKVQLMRKSFQEVTHPDDLKMSLGLVRRLLRGEYVAPQEKRYIRRDGSVVWANLTVALVRDDAGKPLHFVSVMENIFQRKQAEEELLQAHQELEQKVEERTAELGKLAAIVQASDDAIYRKTLDGIITSWNHGAEKLYGYSAAEAVGQHVSMLAPAHDEVSRILKQIRRGKAVEHFESIRVKKSGEAVNVSLTISPIKENGRIVGASTIAKDITAPKLVEEQLRDNEMRLREAQRIAAIGSWEWDLTTNELEWSDQMYRIYGVNPGAYKPTYESIAHFTHPDDLDVVTRHTQQAIRNKSGFEYDYRIIRADNTVLTLLGQGRVMTDRQGKVRKLIGTAQDITERKRVEQLKSDFVSMVSHQLKTPVALIRGYVDNLLAGFVGELTEQQRQYLEDIQEISTNNYSLITDLLNFSRLERGVISVEVEPVKLTEVIDLSLRNYRERIERKGLVLKVGPKDSYPNVLADKFKLVEAISNVIDNAIKFTDQGSIKIRLGLQDKFALVDIKDTGKGMNGELLRKLFHKDQVFSGSPTPEGGSGLGLYIAKSFMEIQGGEVSAYSSPGKGSLFRFKIPLAKVKTPSMIKK